LSLFCRIAPLGHNWNTHMTGTPRSVGLVGVAQDACGRGIGHAMVGAALCWPSGEGVDDVSVATQALNISGLGLYQKSGFAVRSVECGFHKWFGA
jgi:GNAT superfamily N-acetyltransferase